MYPQKIIIISRHGARAPILHIESLPKYDWGIDITDFQKMLSGAPLTNNGRVQCVELGKKTKNEFENFLNEHDKIRIYSSNVERTIESAKLFTQHFDNSDKIEFILDNGLAGDIHFPQEKKDIFMNTRKLIRIDNDTDELRSKIKKTLNFDITESFNYFEISSTLKCYKAEGIFIDIDDELCALIHQCSSECYHQLFSDKQMSELFVSGILNVIEKIKNSDDKFIYISTHDVVLYPLAKMIFDGGKVKMPEFCEQMIMKVYEDKIECHYDGNVTIY
jgi:hypothetical protein